MNTETSVITTEDILSIATPEMTTTVDVAAIDINNLLRDGVLNLIGSFSPEGIPVGGVLAKIIGLFWPESDKSQEVWDSIKQYAEQLVAAAIDKQAIQNLTNTLKGLSDDADDYRNTSFSSSQKGSKLSALLYLLGAGAPSFKEEHNPEKMFPLFTSFGTLWIAALVEQAYLYKEIYHPKDGEHVDLEKHLIKLKENIAKYTRMAQTTYDKLYEWRFSLLQIKEWQWINTSTSESQWYFEDKYGKGYSVESGRGSDYGHSYHNPAGQEYIEAIANYRVAWINSDFVENLQATLAVAQSWQYLDPTVPRPLQHILVSPQGPWGGLGGGQFADRPRDTARITKIRVRHGAVVDGVELFYDDQSGGFHGNPQGGAVSELDLAPDEYVVKVEGRAGSFIDALTFTTNKGRTVGGGGGGGTAFSSAGHPSWKDVSLFAIGGRNDNRRLTQLTFNWKHQTQLLPYIASYKRDGSPILASSNLQLKARESTYVSQVVQEGIARQYYPKTGATPTTLQLRLPNQPGVQTALTDRQVVNIVTTETTAGEYSYLGKYSGENLYYHLNDVGNRSQMWQVLKMIPSDGPVMTGEKIYLRNVETYGYLYPLDSGYLGANWEPFAWEVVPVR